jgi:hypothetical protein
MAGDANSDAVPYGRVIRDGGESVEMYVDRRQSLDTLLRDWTATHEFSHLLLPYVEQRHRWVSEGFAQYYQNVLLARSGAYDRQKAWQELYEGFERGRRSRPELSPNEATAGNHREARMKTYWSGAALALMADVALREQSGGSETLDDVMNRLQACCLPSERVWSGTELFETLDSLASTPVFMSLYRRYADTAGFPDTRPLFARLGLTIAGNEVRLQKSGELAHIRSAITRTDPAAARWRERSRRAAVRLARGQRRLALVQIFSPVIRAPTGGKRIAVGARPAREWEKLDQCRIHARGALQPPCYIMCGPIATGRDHVRQQSRYRGQQGSGRAPLR